MDLRGFPEIVNRNSLTTLETMMLSEIKKRSYDTKSSLPSQKNVQKKSPIATKFIETIISKNTPNLALLLKQYGNSFDTEDNSHIYVPLSALNLAILYDNFEAVKVVLEHLKYKLDDTSILAYA